MPIVRVALLALHPETKWPARMYAELCLQLYDICLHTLDRMMAVNSNLKGAAADHGMMVVMAIFLLDVSADSVDDSYMHTLRSSTTHHSSISSETVHHET